MPTYEYIGDLPVVFIGVRDPATGHTWTPSKGGQITIDETLTNPLVVLVPNVVVEDAIKASPKRVAVVENPESAVEADKHKEI